MAMVRKTIICAGALLALGILTSCAGVKSPAEVSSKLRDSIERLDPTGAGRAKLCEELQAVGAER